MRTLLVNFTESEKKGRKFIYTDYTNIVIHLENENAKQVYVPAVGHKKNLSSLQIIEEAEGIKTQEQMIKIHETKIRKAQIAKEKKIASTKKSIREILNLKRFDKKFECLINAFDRLMKEENGIEIFKEVAKFEKINKSPYSMSFYNAEVDWNFKPQGSLRISDHWNFMSQGEMHCELESTNEYVSKWMLCEYRNGKYHILREF